MKALKLEMLYTNEHRLCPHYPLCEPDAGIGKIRLQEKQQYLPESGTTQIVMVYKGEVEVHLQKQDPLPVEEGYMFLLPGSGSVHIDAIVQSQLICFSLRVPFSLCPSFRLEELAVYAPSSGPALQLLPVNPAISCYLGGLLPFLDSGMRCREYLRGKVNELLFCLRGYYSKEELAAFLSAVLNEEFIFRDRVYASLRNNLKVGELAGELGMCYASLISSFYRVFGTSPKEFIDSYKKEQLLQELTCGFKPLKTLPSEYGFGTYSAFTRFCMSHLNARPADIRAESIKSRQ